MIVIPFELSHEFSDDSTSVENSFALKALLDCLIVLNIGYLRKHPYVPALYASGVVYERTRNWLTIDAMYRRKRGDCKSLAAAVIAERVVHDGLICRPVFRDLVRADGYVDFHILVQTPNGTFEDPSKVCGMRDYQLLNRTSRE